MPRKGRRADVDDVAGEEGQDRVDAGHAHHHEHHEAEFLAERLGEGEYARPGLEI
jgi:hypothetical protein